MAKLTTKARKALPTRTVAAPTQASGYGTTSIKAQVRAAISKKFPGIK